MRVRLPHSEGVSKTLSECASNAHEHAQAFQSEWIKLERIIDEYPEEMRGNIRLLVEELKRLYRAAPEGEISLNSFDKDTRIINAEWIWERMFERITATRELLMKLAGDLKSKNQSSMQET